MNLRPGDVVNWFRVIVDLTTIGGVTLRQIAHAMQIPKATIINWKNGAEPRHSDGERLIAFWCGHLGRERNELPVLSRYAPFV